MEEFPYFIKARSKVKVTTSVPRGWEPKKKKVGLKAVLIILLVLVWWKENI